jgi:transposase
MGRPSLPPGRYFRLLLIGYFEGLDAERGIAWRANDSLAVRSFLRLGLDEAAPDHSTISRTRRLIDLETHRAVFTWVQVRLVEAGLLKGKTVAIDATTLEANAALRSIVRRDTGESYQAFLTALAQASGIATPTREELARLDRKRKKKTSNTDWRHPADPEAEVAKMKDGRTHLAHKAEPCGRSGDRRRGRRDTAGCQSRHLVVDSGVAPFESLSSLSPFVVTEIATCATGC